MTRQEVVSLINECEKNGQFDQHVDPIDWDNALPVDGSFNYLRKGLKQFLQHTFIVKPFTNKVAKKDFLVEVKGKENLKGIKNAIVTCNHINKFDCLVAKYGLKGHKLRITAGHFNNQKGWFGEMMRVGGLMPLSPNFSAMKNFNDAMGHLLTRGTYVMFYPEQAMWWNYKKPRPFKNGAFHYAVKHNVPVIPLFITMEDRPELDEETGFPKQKYTLHIMPAIYPNQNLPKAENVEYVKNANYNACKAKYEEVYNIPLTYTCDEKSDKIIEFKTKAQALVSTLETNHQGELNC